jgi:hypothetical protein
VARDVRVEAPLSLRHATRATQSPSQHWASTDALVGACSKPPRVHVSRPTHIARCWLVGRHLPDPQGQWAVSRRLVRPSNVRHRLSCRPFIALSPPPAPSHVRPYPCRGRALLFLQPRALLSAWVQLQLLPPCPLVCCSAVVAGAVLRPPAALPHCPPAPPCTDNNTLAGAAAPRSAAPRRCPHHGRSPLPYSRGTRARIIPVEQTRIGMCTAANIDTAVSLLGIMLCCRLGHL